ncbi:eukaryotic translation initiation factor 4 gamma-like [Lathyrus oleraceus]|uniref:eukaryotic translation initiation factor 4 gamma-like n=1 Tax=Pisum sativum TaxID=3888 RepID=UPI0021D02DED|nr:eukaryotic translation initiation factor 4 gamma-like [Pisum sativum]
MDWLPEYPPNFMKRMREPSERKSKKKTQKLGEPSVSIPPVPLVSSSSPSKSQPSESPTLILRNDFIKEAGERLQARLTREEKGRARREAEEKAHLEEEEKAREAAEKPADEAAAAAEVEAKAKADTEEATHIIAEEAAKAKDTDLTQGESSHSDFAPLVLKTLEELQKKQQIMRAILDQQDSVNSNIQNLLTQLLQRMPPPQNP